MRDKWIVWVGLNAEQEALAAVLADECVSIDGSTPDEAREVLEERWRTTDIPVMITKPSLFGHGLNWQFCHNVLFLGVSHSFEQFYQACRRSWRYGQHHPVDVHIVSSELEGRVVANLKDKQRKAEELSEETRHHVAAFVRTAVGALARDTIDYAPRLAVKWPAWLRSETHAVGR